MLVGAVLVSLERFDGAVEAEVVHVGDQEMVTLVRQKPLSRPS
jgi:hypothetical protein